MEYTTDGYLDMPLIPGGQWDSEIVGKVMETLRSGQTHYVEVPGHPELRKNLGAYLSSAGISKGGQVLVTAGIQEARFLTVQVLGKELGKITFPQVMHPGVKAVLAVRALDCLLMEVGTDQRMLSPPTAVKKALTDGAKVLYIESPSRLTGGCYKKEELDEIVSLCKKYGASLVVDSGLQALIEDQSASYCFEIDDTTFIIGEAWPGRGIDDLNIGYILTSEGMVKKIAVQKQVISICTSAPSQNGAIAAGSDYTQKHPEIIDSMKKKRIELESILIDLGATIFSTSVVSFVVCSTNPVVQNKLDAANLRFYESTQFGKPGYIQLPVSTKAINALQ